MAPRPAWAIVAEGLFDWLALAQWGLPTCAALGTQCLERVASALLGCPRVFLAFDNDEAGRDGAARLGGLLGPRAAALSLPAGVSDVAELATSSNGQEGLRAPAQAGGSRRRLATQLPPPSL